MNKKKIIITVLALITVSIIIVDAYLLGKTQTPNNYINMHSSEFINNFIDMREISDFTATETDLQIYLKDGNVYFWEK